MRDDQQTSAVLDIVKEFAGRVTRHGDISEVWLFGSWATGESSPESDIDVGVVSETRMSLERELDIFTEGQRIDTRLESVFVDKARFIRARHSLYRDIKDKGIRIA